MGTGFQKRTRPERWRDVRLAVVTYDSMGAVCSCGWRNTSARAKVLEDAIDRHLAKRHERRGIRL